MKTKIDSGTFIGRSWQLASAVAAFGYRSRLFWHHPLPISPSRFTLHPLSLWHRYDRSKQGRRHIKIFCFLSQNGNKKILAHSLVVHGSSLVPSLRLDTVLVCSDFTLSPSHPLTLSVFPRHCGYCSHSFWHHLSQYNHSCGLRSPSKIFSCLSQIENENKNRFWYIRWSFMAARECCCCVWIPFSFVLISLISPSPHCGSHCTQSPDMTTPVVSFDTVTPVSNKVVVTLQ